ncbi:MAG TPA: hypothetical protein V6C81_24685 [Planktothrix sp.]
MASIYGDVPAAFPPAVSVSVDSTAGASQDGAAINPSAAARHSMSQEAFAPASDSRVARVTDFSKSPPTVEALYKELSQAGDTCYHYGMARSLPLYKQAIQMADAINPSGSSAGRDIPSRQDNEKAYDAVTAPGTARANLGCAEIRCGAKTENPEMVIEGEQYIGEAMRRNPEMKTDPYFIAALNRAATALKQSSDQAFRDEGDRIQKELQSFSPDYRSSFEKLPPPGQDPTQPATARPPERHEQQPVPPVGRPGGSQRQTAPGEQPAAPAVPGTAPGHDNTSPPNQSNPSSDAPTSSGERSSANPSDNSSGDGHPWAALLGALGLMGAPFALKPFLRWLGRQRDYFKQAQQIREMFGDDMKEYTSDEKVTAEQREVGGEIEINGKKVKVSAGEWVVKGADGKTRIMTDKEFKKAYDSTGKPGEYVSKTPERVARGEVAKADATFKDLKGVEHTVKKGQTVLLNEDGTVSVVDSPEAAKLKLMPEAPKKVAPDSETGKANADATAKPNADATAKPNADATAKPNADATAKPNADATAKPNADATAKPNADATAKPNADATAKPKADATAKPNADAPDTSSPDPATDGSAGAPPNGTDATAGGGGAEVPQAGKRVRRGAPHVTERIAVNRHADGTFAKSIEIPGDFKAGADPQADADLLAEARERLSDRRGQLEKLEKAGKIKDQQKKELDGIVETQARLDDPLSRASTEQTVLQTLEQAKGTEVVAGHLLLNGEPTELPIEREGGGGGGAGKLIIVGVVLSAVLGAVDHFMPKAEAQELPPATIEGR